MGKISFDSGTTEKVLIIGAQSPGGGGELSTNLLRPGGSSNDADMIKTYYANHEDGHRFLIPAHGFGGNGGITARLYSSRFVYQLQDDPASGPYGRIVVYATNGTTNELLWQAVAVLTPSGL